MTIPDEVLADVAAGELLVLRCPTDWNVEQIRRFVDYFGQVAPPAVRERTVFVTNGFELVPTTLDIMRGVYNRLREILDAAPGGSA